jgi:hypothetical protein
MTKKQILIIAMELQPELCEWLLKRLVDYTLNEALDVMIQLFETGLEACHACKATEKPNDTPVR